MSVSYTHLQIVIGGKVSTGENATNAAESFIDNISLEYRLDRTGTRYVRLFLSLIHILFAPSKKDTAGLVNTSLEIATDTILEPVKSADSLQHKILSLIHIYARTSLRALPTNCVLR